MFPFTDFSLQAANRRRALERLRQAGIRKDLPGAPSNNTSQREQNDSSISKRPRIELTPEQKLQIERNRARALERLQKAQVNLRDATGKRVTTLAFPSVRNPEAFKLDNRPLDNIRLSLRKSDYIDYDFSTMKDSFGGFISDDPKLKAKDEKSLEQWKEDQKSKITTEPPPPQDISNLPKCHECQSIEIDQQLFTVFDCKVCKKCKELKPEKYSLLTKTECREDYFLTDPELKDTSLLKRLEKPNPYSGTYSRMQLFLRYQVEEYAFKKWGGEEGLDKEWQRREEMRVNRREKKFESKLKEMRKRTRAEEYTRKLRNNSDAHVHEWSALVQIPGEEEGMVKKRCIGCGMEIEQFMI